MAERGLVAEAGMFEEAQAFNSRTGELKVTIIRPGFNTSKGRYYTPQALRESADRFVGAKCYVNHATKAENAARPEGSVHDWVANVTKTAIESDGRMSGVVKVHDKTFKEKLAGLKEANLLPHMGMSIRAAGMQEAAMIEGQRTMQVNSLDYIKSLDFVTEAGAGGQVHEMAESAGAHILTADELFAEFAESAENDIDLVSVDVLRLRRPDFVAAILTESKDMKTVEQLQAELNEANTKIAAAETAKTDAEAKLLAAQESADKAIVASTLTTKLSESKLPEIAQTRIKAQFKEATKVDGIQEAITAEEAYIKSLGVPEIKRVKGMGTADVSESGGQDAEKLKKDYIASQVHMGISQEAAEKNYGRYFSA